MAAIAGVDVGTTSSKAVIYGEDGAVLGAGRAPTTWDVGPHGTQTDADVLLRSAFDALSSAAETAGMPVRAVGVAGMGESGVLTDAHERPLAPVIAWHDDRDGDEVESWPNSSVSRRSAGSRESRCAVSSADQAPLAAAPTLYPGRRDALRRGRLGGRRLGGDAVLELSLAGRTGWLDVAARDWWDDALTWSGASRELMPPLVRAGVAVGKVTSDAVSSLLRGALLTPAGHDHQASALGARAIGPGHELDSASTAEALVRTVSRPPSRVDMARLAASEITTDPSIETDHWTRSEAPKAVWRKTAHSSCSAWVPTGWSGSTPPPRGRPRVV